MGGSTLVGAIPFVTPEDWAAWLADHHANRDEVWVKIYKKSSGIPSIDWAQAVVEALKAKGIKIVPWTVNEIADIERMKTFDLDGIITDYPDRAVKVFKK